MNHKRLFSATGLALTALLLLIAVAVISSFPRLRIDLTADRLYTLADGTRNIVRDLEEPLELIFFYSDGATADVPQVRAYGNRVQELLREMVIASNGNLSLRVIDPEPFSVEEELATEYGIRAVPLAAGAEEVYFGIVALDPATDTEANRAEGTVLYEAMPLIRPDQEEFLEYEFSRLITQVANPDPVVVGLMSSLPIDGGFNAAAGRATPAWAITESMRHLYEVERIDPMTDWIEDHIDILMVVHPQEMPDTSLYAIDQFIMNGGRAMIFVDPNSDTQTNQMLAQGEYFDILSSDLGPLFDAWGIDYDPSQVVTDQELALFITMGQQQRPITHVGMLGVQRPGFSNDIITGSLEVMNMASPGALYHREDASTDFEPLIRTTERSGLIDNVFFRDLTDPTILLDEFSATDERYVMAARISGMARSAFPDGPPLIDADEPRGIDVVVEDGEAVVQDPLEDQRDYPPHINETREAMNVILVADTDVLTDRMWARPQNVMGQRITQAFANNGDFVINALDNLGGSQELISIRGRGSYARPFTRVLAMQREADERLREEETNLLRSLSQTEQQIAALSQEGDGSGAMTPQQEAEIERFMQQQLETRRRLREVRHQLNRDIEDLGSRLQLINTALIPALLVIAALLVGYLRRRRRHQRQQV